MITVPAGYKLVPLELTKIQAKAAWPYHYWIDSFLYWREIDYKAVVAGFPTLVGFKYRHSEQSPWHYGVDPRSWYECLPVFENDEDAVCVGLLKLIQKKPEAVTPAVEEPQQITPQVSSYEAAVLRSVASWIKQLPYPTDGAGANLLMIDNALGTHYLEERMLGYKP